MKNDFIKKPKLALYLTISLAIIVMLFSILNYKFANDTMDKYVNKIAKEINLRVYTHLE